MEYFPPGTLEAFSLYLARTSALIIASPLLGTGTGFAGYKVGLIAALAFLLYSVGGRDALMDQAQRLGLGDHFELVGPLYGMDKLRFYAGCSVLVLASHSENFGNVVVEALNVGTPVVASHGTPWAELAELGCGAWVDNQPQPLADAIVPFLTSPELRRNASVAARRLVQQKYTWPNIARQMLRVYEDEIRRYNKL